MHAATLAEVVHWSAQEVLDTLRSSEERNARLQRDVESLKQQLERFRRQIFGSTSERRIVASDALQLHLGELLPLPESAPAGPTKSVPAHTRRVPRSDLAATGHDESSLFFDESRMPVIVISYSPFHALAELHGAAAAPSRTSRALRRGSPLLSALDLRTHPSMTSGQG